MQSINVLFPVKNEQVRLEHGIRRTCEVLDEVAPGAYTVTIIDNGSSDSTPLVAARLCGEIRDVRYVRIERCGVGAALRAGIGCNESDIVGYMDVDLATSPEYLRDVIEIFDADREVEMINAVRWSCSDSNQGRPLRRRVASAGLVAYLKIALGLKSSDAVCGFKFFRREIAEVLVAASDNEQDGWPFVIEVLALAERAGVRIVELPVHWHDDGRSSVKVVAQTMEYLVEVPKIRKRVLGCGECAG